MSRRVAAVIVAYGSNAELPGCLGALRGKVDETVVIDNCPEAPVPAALRAAHAEVRWIRNASNRGFAAAVNQGIAATSAPLVLLLNPDCELLTGVERLVAACEPPDVAGAGGLLVNQDGSPQAGFFARSLPTAWALALEAAGLNRAWPGNPVNRRYRLLGMDPAVGQDVEQPAGALLLLRRAALESVGGMDERFRPLWFEDVDLCKRLREAGYRLRYTPHATAVHRGGHSVRGLAPDTRIRAWYCGLLRYAGKHFSEGAYRRVRFAVLAGTALRRAYWLAAGGPPAESSAYRAVFRQVRLGRSSSRHAS